MRIRTKSNAIKTAVLSSEAENIANRLLDIEGEIANLSYKWKKYAMDNSIPLEDLSSDIIRQSGEMTNNINSLIDTAFEMLVIFREAETKIGEQAEIPSEEIGIEEQI